MVTFHVVPALASGVLIGLATVLLLASLGRIAGASSILARLLVGFGTSFARGCTSGHRVCGLGRLSGRSFAATVTFLVVGIVTTFVARYVLGVPP